MKTQCGTRKPVTRKLHEQNGCSWGRSLAISSLSTSFSLQIVLLKFFLSSVFLVLFVWAAACRRGAVWVSWMSLWPLGQSAGTHGREAAVWAGSFSDAPGAWSAAKPQLMKKPTRWGKRCVCQWKLNHLSSINLSPPPPPPCGPHSPPLCSRGNYIGQRVG